MRQDKPFIIYEGGALPFVIVPRGWKGWSQFAIWLALLAPLVLWLSNHMQTPQSGTDFGTGVFLFIMGLTIWLVSGLWWAVVRAEVIRMVEIRRQKQYARRKLAREQARAEAQTQGQQQNA